jgi:hypothetical protein
MVVGGSLYLMNIGGEAINPIKFSQDDTGTVRLFIHYRVNLSACCLLVMQNCAQQALVYMSNISS